MLAAARRLFVGQGYFNTTIPDIVRASGVSVGSIYHHFGGKQEIAAALYRETMAELLAGMEARAAGEATIQRRLLALTELLYASCEQDPERLEYMLFVRHTEVDPDEVPVCLATPFRMVSDWIAEGMERGEVARGPIDLVAGAFMGAVLKVVELRLRGKLARPLPGVAKDAFALAWRAIAAQS